MKWYYYYACEHLGDNLHVRKDTLSDDSTVKDLIFDLFFIHILSKHTFSICI